MLTELFLFVYAVKDGKVPVRITEQESDERRNLGNLEKKLFLRRFQKNLKSIKLL